MGWIVWDKGQHGLTMSDGELAWSSFDKALRIITLNRCTIGERGGNIHRCQKPVKLYAEILDACCGSRMFWFDKENPLILFADIRDEEHTLCDGRSLKVHPDIVSDFTDMPFLDKSFKLVVFDPPHLLKVGQNSWLAKKYGKLPEDWPRVIKKGIDECFRVLEDYGVLIFKWNEEQITVREVLKAIGRQPLFGHTTGRHGKTMWMCFMKLPIYE